MQPLNDCGRVFYKHQNMIVASVILFSFLSTSVYGTQPYKYDTKWFEVPLDHFGFNRSETFKIKYLVNEEHWDRTNGPIFFYTGNEGQIEVFLNHTGFVWEIAPEFKAKVVFAEHRYYGSSMPFGNQSLDNQHIGYLTSAQALADYADLVDFLLGSEEKSKHPVIAFGGSYGGMLAAYFRIKYPHLVQGAIAASAPIHQFTGMVPCGVFDRIVTSSFRIAGANCVTNIKKSWAVIRNLGKNANDSDWLKTEWKLCDPVKNSTDMDDLIDFLNTLYGTTAMVNYPFDCDFLVPLPANPVRYVCQFLEDSNLADKNLLKAIGQVLNTYTNYTGKTHCVDYKAESDYGNLDASGWDYQACTEMVMPMCSNGVDDMFEPSPWNYTSFADNCKKKFGVYPKPQMARIEYGGDNLRAASNIVFSNGVLDPWAGGGILTNINDDLRAVLILDSAHHLDLMASNPNDPHSVVLAREIHKNHIREWITDFVEAASPHNNRLH